MSSRVIEQTLVTDKPRAATSATEWTLPAFESFARGLREQISPFAEAMRQMAASLAPIAAEWTASMAKLAPLFEEASRFTKTAPSRARAAFLAVGYPPTDLITLGELRAIVEAHESGSHEALRKAVAAAVDDITETRAGRAHLRSRWSTSSLVVKSRLRILRDALNAHRLRLYGVSIPAMIAQTEGLIAHAYTHNASMNGAQFKAYLTDAAKEDWLFGPVLEAFASQVLLTHFSHGSPVPSDLSRHAILHGGDTAYASRENSAKAILLFDYVLNLVEPGRGRMPAPPAGMESSATA